MSKSRIALASLIIGVLYVGYLINYFICANANSASDSEALGAAIATAFVLLHMLVVILAVIFNAVAYFLKYLF